MLTAGADRATADDGRPGLVAPETLSVRAVDSLAGLDELRGEWDGLFAAAGGALPFSTHAWARAWWVHLSRDSAAARDRLCVQVVRDAAGELVAVAPFMRTERPGRGPLRAREIRLLGADANITEIRRILVAPSNEAAVLTACSRYWLERPGEWDRLRVAAVAAAGEIRDIAGHAAAAWSREFEAFVLPLPASWDEFRAGLKRNIRESLRKCYNSLSRDGHNFDFVVAETPEEVDRALDVVFDLHGRRAALEDTVAHPDYFADPRIRAFVRAVCRDLAAQRAVRVFSVVIAGRTVAARIAFVFGDRMYLYYSGFDPEWGRYSVMTTVVAEAFKYAMGAGIRRVHLSIGRDVSKTRWGPEETLYREATLISPTSRARATVWLLDRLRASQDRQRGNPA
jgi:CelD/BcsL family acetyltransferase involved in cellulose biosynthesis